MESSLPRRVKEFREQYRAQQIGPRYSGWLHFCSTTFFSLLVIGLAISQLEQILWSEWLTVPISFLFANYAEYKGHKGPMHRPLGMMRLLYHRHTLEHHNFFTHDAMSYQSSKDFKMVLFPPIMLFFFLGVIATPIALLLFFLSTKNVGYLFVVTSVGYFLTYEWLHFAYHLNQNSWVGRLPFMAKLRRHHTQHHNATLMSKWNFNITFPICDHFFGTHFDKR